MPELNPKTIQETYFALSQSQNQIGKFVRNKDLIWWGFEGSQHRDLLTETNLTSLDDHGFLLAFEDDGINFLSVSLISTGLNSHQFPVNEEARATTAAIIKNYAKEANFRLQVAHEL